MMPRDFPGTYLQQPVPLLGSAFSASGADICANVRAPIYGIRLNYTQRLT
jgi:hypothetical protein